MKFKKKTKDKQESPFDHHICKMCGKVGHRLEMETIDCEAWSEWKDMLSYAAYGVYGDLILCIKNTPDWVLVHKDCAPIKKRAMFSGWELSDVGKARLEKAKRGGCEQKPKPDAKTKGGEG